MLSFVLGSGRCGSTLVTELAARHPDVGFISNVDDKFGLLNLKGRWNNALFNRSSERDPSLRPFKDRRQVIEPGRFRVAPSEGWEVLERQVSTMFPQPCRDLVAADATPWLQKRIADFFDSRMEAQGKPVFVHHLTGWPRSGLLRTVYPQARFVHVVRDGRAVANSWLQMGWWDGYRGPDSWYLGPLSHADRQEWEESNRSFVVLAGLGWRILIDAIDQARALVPEGQWLDVRLEDLMEDPRGKTAEVLEFLGLEWTPQYEAGFRRHTFQASRGVAWQRDLSAEQVHLLERTIAKPLATYGYELTDSAPGHN
ncbi:sulfotransferase [Knoellia sp. p5-6-4]|uniref:sulfotransferase family protein n=1 Tax=unclassified Knoellia TaxID=2618719 RepID=UPI0023D9E227|nr:sulfotransferase [Knoellia sp. p5-6-4]MDF2144219.1 sulfotransferase [Knoellia sp. p5-6-4]